MYVTEEEAKRKWCSQPMFDRCAGSKCMAWRWATPGKFDAAISIATEEE